MRGKFMTFGELINKLTVIYGEDCFNVYSDIPDKEIYIIKLEQSKRIAIFSHDQELLYVFDSISMYNRNNKYYAVVMKNKKYGVMNMNGELEIDINKNYIDVLGGHSFNINSLIVEEGDKVHRLYTDFIPVSKEYNRIVSGAGSYVIVVDYNGKSGLIRMDGTVVYEPQFDKIIVWDIRHLRKGTTYRFRAEKDNKIEYYRLEIYNGEEIFFKELNNKYKYC